MLFRPRTFEPRLAYTPHGFSQRNTVGGAAPRSGGGGGRRGPGGRCPAGPAAGEQLLRHFLEYTLYSQSNLNLLYIPTCAPPIPHPVRAAQRRRGRSSSLGVIRLVCMLAPWHTTPLLPLPRSPPPHRVGSPPQLGRLLSDGAALVRLSRSPSGVSFPLPPRVSVGDRHTQIAGCGMSSRHRLCPGHAHLDDCDSA